MSPRTKEEITALIIHHAQSVNTITRITYNCHLNYTVTKKYIDRMIESGLLEKVDDKYYRPTEKGFDFLRYHHAMRNLMDNQELGIIWSEME